MCYFQIFQIIIKNAKEDSEKQILYFDGEKNDYKSIKNA